ncbi:heterokaryon incompatibility protein-domain-containing protein [Clohesyomyces aquaticus]|uniref:Heterokaryon incompatibility protein-domain-containing protein n=1 Tax=Clohesyomyces aquaticus TaxID=1231657 RepID=A0A1Y1ZT54_9PLEO|nr:heterokaryon incompatibility protein-domain-containing protein [Clohesyomyces aquaticus]
MVTRNGGMGSVLKAHGPFPFRYNRLCGSRQFSLIAMDGTTTPLYDPLDSGRMEIRVLELRPFFNDDSMIKCRLRKACLQQSVSYAALSYVWGDPSITENIIVDGHVVAVTTNLVLAMRGFCRFVRRSHIAEDIDRYTCLLWADALCINQSDITERDSQVRLMGQIYSKAEQTLVWLGPSDEDSAVAIDFVSLINKGLGELNECPDDASLLFEMNSSRDSPGWGALGNLLSRPWFQRVWVIQEVALSRDVHVLCGDQGLRWEEIASMVEGLFERRLLHLIKLPQRPNSLTSGSSTLWGMQDIRRKLTGGRTQSLSAVFFSTLGFLSTNAKDKVFGIMGLIDPKHAAALDVNYQNTEAEVYSKAAQISLMSEGSFDIICLAGITHGSKVGQLPSWVPDFSHDLPINPFGIPSPLHEKVHYSAGISSEADSPPLIDVSERCLRVMGQVIDTIFEFGSVRIPANQQHCEGVSWYEWAHDAIKLAQKHEQVRRAPNASKILWRALIANATLHSKEPPPLSYRTYFETFKRLYLGRRHLDWKDIHQAVMDDDSSSKEDKAQAYEYFFAFLDSSIGRRFCVTANGYIGIVPAGIQEGDRICVICGATVPFVLRPTSKLGDGDSEAFQLVGDCYIDGLMGGEAFFGGTFQKIAII